MNKERDKETNKDMLDYILTQAHALQAELAKDDEFRSAWDYCNNSKDIMSLCYSEFARQVTKYVDAYDPSDLKKLRNFTINEARQFGWVPPETKDAWTFLIDTGWVKEIDIETLLYSSTFDRNNRITKLATEHGWKYEDKEES